MKDKRDPLAKRLDAIINLLFELGQKREKAFSSRDKIRILNSTRLSPSEIAIILGKSDTYVNKELSLLRKKRPKKERDGDEG